MTGYPSVSRRQLLAGAAAAGACAAAGFPAVRARAAPPAGSAYEPAREPLQLGKLAGEKGILYGTVLSPRLLPPSPAHWDEAAYCRMVERQAAIVTNADLHFDLVQPAAGRFDFTAPDRIADFVLGNGMQMRGHALCWYQHFPKWMAGMDRAAAIRAVEEHIGTVMRHYAGRVHSWDVVNEALSPDDHAPGGLRVSGFTRTIGLDWMEFAFRAARRADPHALLTYNDYRIEVTHYGDSDARRAGMLTLLDGFRRRQVPIDAVGIQSHIDYGAWKHFDAGAFAGFLGEVAARGVRIFLTELDVIDTGSPTAPGERDRIIADIYRTYLTVALENPAVEVVVDWGLCDKEAWQNSPYAANPNFRRADGTPGRGLPFDADLRPKPAAEAIAQVFASLPKTREQGQPLRIRTGDMIR